jgi:glucosamine--fructose-6-phosphate aminotransferase (isomerizing)
MCGIVGVVGREDAAPRLLEALRRLEYRGYDSAGIATIHDDVMDRRRAPGKLANLARELALNPLPGQIGIAHTRWATHGPPSDVNAHPHISMHGEVAVVHNGVIDNFASLRQAMIAEGCVRLCPCSTVCLL